MKLDHQLTPHTKINSRWTKDLNISHDTIKVLEENIGRNVSDIPHSNIFTDNVPLSKGHKGKNKQMGLYQIKKTLHSNRKHQQNEKGINHMENIFTNDTSYKGLISKRYKELTWLHSKKTSNPIKKWAKDLNWHFSKRTYRGSRDVWKDVQYL